MWNALVIAFVVTAALADLRWRKIPRALTVAGLIAGLIAHWHYGGLASSAFAALIGFAVGLALFALGAIGGGDVKLITALGALLGFSIWTNAMLISVLVAAIIGLIQAIARGLLIQTLRNTYEILKSLVLLGPKQHPAYNVRNTAMVRTPFGVAAAIGTVVAMVRV